MLCWSCHVVPAVSEAVAPGLTSLVVGAEVQCGGDVGEHAGHQSWLLLPLILHLGRHWLLNTDTHTHTDTRVRERHKKALGRGVDWSRYAQLITA